MLMMKMKCILDISHLLNYQTIFDDAKWDGEVAYERVAWLHQHLQHNAHTSGQWTSTTAIRNTTFTWNDDKMSALVCQMQTAGAYSQMSHQVGT